MPAHLAALVGAIADVDIYLLDQIARGRIVERDRVLDAGCGDGRNAAILLRVGCTVTAVDREPSAVEAVRGLAARLAPHLPAANFRAEAIENMTCPVGSVDVVVCSAVLHFAADDPQFDAMVGGMWRVLRPGGLLFCRLATTIALEQARAVRLTPGQRIYRLGDGSIRYLADEAQLVDATASLGGQLADPLKTTVVQGQRCMTTWVVRRDS